jgi:hypothetical protein
MSKKLRLLITKECPHNCEGCCNKDWNLKKLPVVKHYNYDEVFITGGEPLNPYSTWSKTELLLDYLHYIDINPKRKLYIYTTNTNSHKILWKCDGVTLTLHDQESADEFLSEGYHSFKGTAGLIKHNQKRIVSLRLNIFKGIDIPEDVDLSIWNVKRDIVWIENCPLPEDEFFMRTKTI